MIHYRYSTNLWCANSGGVYAPGAAFAETSLMSQLENHGLRLELVKKEQAKL
jgi:hypothetical protein